MKGRISAPRTTSAVSLAFSMCLVGLSHCGRSAVDAFEPSFDAAGSRTIGASDDGGDNSRGGSSGSIIGGSGSGPGGGIGITCPDSSTCVDGPMCCARAGVEGGGPSAIPSDAHGGDGLTNCGASGERCGTSLEVTGGTYDRWFGNDGHGATSETSPATVSTFRLDKYDVTVGRFRQFVAAWNDGRGYTPPAGSGKHAHLNGGRGLANSESPGTYETGWLTSDNGNIAPTKANLGSSLCSPYNTWTNTAGAQEDLPINCVNWYEAYAFCIWDGGFLPSEAEWIYAAVGGAQQREYPWGSTEMGTSNQYAIYDCYYPAFAGSCGLSNIAPVGTPALGAGLWGQLDLEGEMMQWTLDWYETAPGVGSYVDGTCADCAYLTAACSSACSEMWPPYKAVHGCTFDSGGGPDCLPASRNTFLPTLRDGGMGFRCARTP